MKTKRSRTTLSTVLMMAIICLLLTATACGKRVENSPENGAASTATSEQGGGAGGTAEPSPSPTPSPSPSPSDDPLKSPYHSDDNPVVTIEMDNGKKIVAELYPQVAPNTVNNFISLVKKGFYDGLIFHRVIPDFMIQGGDPDGVGTGGPGYGIKGEFSENGVKNDLLHKPGVLSMARAGDPDSAGSQFFIMVAGDPSLDGKYAAFGQVLEGMDVVDEIVSQPRDSERPTNPMAMKKVTVDTKGKSYPEPETIK